MLNEIFIERKYNGPTLRVMSDFVTPHINTVHFGKDSLRYFGSKILDLIAREIIQVHDVKLLKSLIRNWAPAKCPCRLCKTIVLGVGYI